MKISISVGIALLLAAGPTGAYPLDGFPKTGMMRLVAYRLAAASSGRPDFLTEGEMLPSDAITLGLRDHPGFSIPSPDPALSARVKEMLGGDARAYGVTLLDWSDPNRPRYASVNGGREQNPGNFEICWSCQKAKS